MIESPIIAGFVGGVIGGGLSTIVFALIVYREVKKKISDSPVGDMFL